MDYQEAIKPFFQAINTEFHLGDGHAHGTTDNDTFAELNHERYLYKVIKGYRFTPYVTLHILDDIEPAITIQRHKAFNWCVDHADDRIKFSLKRTIADVESGIKAKIDDTMLDNGNSQLLN